MIDKAKFGEAVAKVMDRLDKLIEIGELTDEHEIGEVLVVAVFNRPLKNPEPGNEGAIESFVLLDGTTQIPYIQEGVLRYAQGIVDTSVEDDDDEDDDE